MVERWGGLVLFGRWGGLVLFERWGGLVLFGRWGGLVLFGRYRGAGACRRLGLSAPGPVAAGAGEAWCRLQARDGNERSVVGVPIPRSAQEVGAVDARLCQTCASGQHRRRPGP